MTFRGKMNSRALKRPFKTFESGPGGSLFVRRPCWPVVTAAHMSWQQKPVNIPDKMTTLPLSIVSG